MATAKNITARKKIAAAALALGAGVIGTGFAAGVIDFQDGASGGMGAGTKSISNYDTTYDQIDITGDLTITGSPDIAALDGTKGYQVTEQDSVIISGFDALENATGATYKVAAKYGVSANSTYAEVATGVVEPGAQVTVERTNRVGDPITGITVMLQK